MEDKTQEPSQPDSSQKKTSPSRHEAALRAAFIELLPRLVSVREQVDSAKESGNDCVVALANVMDDLCVAMFPHGTMIEAAAALQLAGSIRLGMCMERAREIRMEAEAREMFGKMVLAGAEAEGHG